MRLRIIGRGQSKVKHLLSPLNACRAAEVGMIANQILPWKKVKLDPTLIGYFTCNYLH